MRLMITLTLAITLALILTAVGLKIASNTEAKIPTQITLTYTSKTYSICHMVKPGDPILDALGNVVMKVASVSIHPEKTWLLTPNGNIVSIDIPNTCQVIVELQRVKDTGLLEQFLTGGTYRIRSSRWIRNMRVLEVQK